MFLKSLFRDLSEKGEEGSLGASGENTGTLGWVRISNCHNIGSLGLNSEIFCRGKNLKILSQVEGSLCVTILIPTENENLKDRPGPETHASGSSIRVVTFSPTVGKPCLRG